MAGYAAGGYYESAAGRHPRIQLLSVEDLFAGKTIDYPVRYGLVETPRPRKRTVEAEQLPLGDADYGYVESAGA